MAKFKAEIIIPARTQFNKKLDSISKIKSVISKALGIPLSYIKIK